MYGCAPTQSSATDPDECFLKRSTANGSPYFRLGDEIHDESTLVEELTVGANKLYAAQSKVIAQPVAMPIQIGSPGVWPTFGHDPKVWTAPNANFVADVENEVMANWIDL